MILNNKHNFQRPQVNRAMFTDSATSLLKKSVLYMVSHHMTPLLQTAYTDTYIHQNSKMINNKSHKFTLKYLE